MAADFAAAQQEAYRSDFCLVAGTSLTVFPAAEIPLTVGRFAIVNREPTPLDDQAEVRIGEPIGETLAAVVEYIREKREGQ
jgi:NAD-dependent deacetylase